jgi:hypothetical protein
MQKTKSVKRAVAAAEKRARKAERKRARQAKELKPGSTGGV